MTSGPSDLITQITRRQWLLRLGETVALAGVSGLIPESPLRFFSDEPPSLPPGLYEPSADHLVSALSGHHPLVPPAASEDRLRPDRSFLPVAVFLGRGLSHSPVLFPLSRAMYQATL